MVSGPVVWSTPGATWRREPAPSGVALNMERRLLERPGFPRDSSFPYTPASRMQTPCRGSAVRWVRPTEVLVTRTPSAGAHTCITLVRNRPLPKRPRSLPNSQGRPHSDLYRRTGCGRALVSTRVSGSVCAVMGRTDRPALLPREAAMWHLPVGGHVSRVRLGALTSGAA